MNILQRVALFALVAGGLAANLGSNFIPPSPDDAGCRAGSGSLQASGNNQTGVAGAPLGQNLDVTALCTNARTGQTRTVDFGTIEWRVASGNGSVNGSPTASTSASPYEQDQVNWTLGAALGT